MIRLEISLILVLSLFLLFFFLKKKKKKRYLDTFRFRQDLQFIDSRGSVVRRRGRRSMETGGRDMVLFSPGMKANRTGRERRRQKRRIMLYYKGTNAVKHVHVGMKRHPGRSHRSWCGEVISKNPGRTIWGYYGEIMGIAWLNYGEYSLGKWLTIAIKEHGAMDKTSHSLFCIHISRSRNPPASSSPYYYYYSF